MNHTVASYLDPSNLGAWGTYLEQVDRVTPYLGHLSQGRLSPGWHQPILPLTSLSLYNGLQPHY